MRKFRRIPIHSLPRTQPRTYPNTTLNRSVQPAESLLAVFSTFTKSSAINVYLLPVCLAFDAHLYVVLLLVSCLTSYATHLLKWMLADSRPYWWVQQTEAYGALGRPVVRQSEITCETSAGNPSGHVMLNAAYLYVLVHWTLQSATVRRLQLAGCSGRWLRPLGWSLYAAGVGTVAVSRMYFGCHYLHQCALGAALGFALARYLVQPNGWAMQRLLEADRWWLAQVGATMAALAVATYFGQIALQVDPLWSIRTVRGRTVRLGC